MAPAQGWHAQIEKCKQFFSMPPAVQDQQANHINCQHAQDHWPNVEENIWSKSFSHSVPHRVPKNPKAQTNNKNCLCEWVWTAGQIKSRRKCKTDQRSVLKRCLQPGKQWTVNSKRQTVNSEPTSTLNEYYPKLPRAGWEYMKSNCWWMHFSVGWAAGEAW